ncbi:MAG: lysozyme inhibitor LprI family protein, partial [Rhizomicrobium sp.]
IGHCVAYTEDREEQYRRLELYNLSEDFSTPQRIAFGKLSGASWAYSEAHAKYEMGETTLPREQVYAQAVGAKQKDFHYKIKALEARIFPPDRKGGYKPDQADKELNSLYHRIVSGPWADPADHPGAVTLSGLRRTERAWVAYKDAWNTFVQLRQPGSGISPEVQAYLTEERVRDLKAAYGEK